MVKLFIIFLFSSTVYLNRVNAVTLNVRMTEDPKTLDWNGQAFPGSDAMIINQLEQGLYTYLSPDGKIEPALSERIEISKDLTEYKFFIRKDARWSDGRPVYAQDFVDSWIRLLSPQSTSVYTHYLSDLKNALEYHQGKISNTDLVGVHATNDLELKVQLKHPIRNWMKNTAFYPLYPIRKDVILKYGTGWTKPGVLLSSGPFVLDSYEQGKEVRVKRNPHFLQNPKSNIHEIVFKIVPQVEKAISMYEKGDFFFLNGTLNKVIPNPKIKNELKRFNTHRLHLLSLNKNKFPLSNSLFRAAIADAIDPTKALSQLVPGMKVYSAFTPSIDPNFSAYHPDSTKCKKELLDSGVMLGKKNLQLLSYPDEFTMAVTTKIAEQIQKRLGIGVDIIGGPDYQTLRNLGQYDLVYHTWIKKTNSDYESLENFSSESTHDQKIDNQFFNDFVLAAKSATNDADEIKSLRSGEKLLADQEHFILPLYIEDDLYFVSPRIFGLQFNQMAGPILKDVFLKP